MPILHVAECGRSSSGTSTCYSSAGCHGRPDSDELLLGFLLGFPAGAVEVYGRGPLKRAVETAGVVLRGTSMLVIIILLFFGSRCRVAPS